MPFTQRLAGLRHPNQLELKSRGCREYSTQQNKLEEA